MGISAVLQEREKKYRPYLEKYATLFNLDANLVRALISHESQFNPEAVSSTGAYGLGQFTGIAARQVREIAKLDTRAADLATFEKSEASNPDRGIKAICAYLWWIKEVKYKKVVDKKVQLEAVLTFYNAGSAPADLVVLYGGYTQALPYIQKLSPPARAQATIFAPAVAQLYVDWHALLKKTEAVQPGAPAPVSVGKAIDPFWAAFILALKMLGDASPQLDVFVASREGLTEVTLVIPGELKG